MISAPAGCVVALAACACGSGGEPANVPLDRAGAAFGAALCERLFACCSAEEFAARFDGITPAITDQASCAGHVSRVFGNEFIADAEHAEEQGWARYHGDQMAACVDHVRADSCTHLARAFFLLLLPDDCVDPREPLVAEGAACDHNFQCLSGYCEGGGAAVEGMCRPLPLLGQPCPDSVCVPGLYCDAQADPAAACAALRADGAACTSRFQCASFSCNGLDPQVTPGVCGAPTTCDGP